MRFLKALFGDDSAPTPPAPPVLGTPVRVLTPDQLAAEAAFYARHPMFAHKPAPPPPPPPGAPHALSAATPHAPVAGGNPTPAALTAATQMISLASKAPQIASTVSNTVSDVSSALSSLSSSFSGEEERNARDLFDRARAGDQNAMKELVKVREGAMAGNPHYRRAHDFLLQYGRQHPMDRRAEMSGEERHALGILRAADQNDPRAVMAALHRLPTYGHPDTIRAACVALAHQKPWTDPRLASFEGLLPDEPRRAVFRQSIRVAPDRREMDAIRAYIPADMQGESDGSLCAGYCFGTARKFQLARLPTSPISVMGADIGWECGL
jgi:hypothetical protein